MKVDYDDLIINYYEKMEIIEKQDIKINVLNREIERLNNIINELEDYFENDTKDAMEHFECGRCFNFKDLERKLQELKGEDKE